IQIRRDRDVAGGSEPARVLADVVVEAERLVQDDDAGPRPVPARGLDDVHRDHGSISTFRVPGDTRCSSASRVRSSGNVLVTTGSASTRPSVKSPIAPRQLPPDT